MRHGADILREHALAYVIIECMVVLTKHRYPELRLIRTKGGLDGSDYIVSPRHCVIAYNGRLDRPGRYAAVAEALHQLWTVKAVTNRPASRRRHLSAVS